MNKKHIVVIDDEEHILELIKYNLEANGFIVSTYTSVEAMQKSIGESPIDLILLDIMLPGMDGITALNIFRNHEQLGCVPVLLVSAKAEEIDKILGLELGADDYITKPFSVRELVARVKAILRRADRNEVPTKKTEEDHFLVHQDLKLDIESHLLTFKDEPIELTYKEFEILKLLMGNKGKVLTREVILDKVWGYDYYGETRTVDVHIRYLRAKFEAYGIGEYIETVRGVGYRFVKE